MPEQKRYKCQIDCRLLIALCMYSKAQLEIVGIVRLLMNMAMCYCVKTIEYTVRLG